MKDVKETYKYKAHKTPIHTTTVLTFGKYKGKTPQQVNDIDYFIWLRNNSEFTYTAQMMLYTNGQCLI